ncbi:cation channel family protein [Stylonychia lemnae]|uniref:Cation channel family protein n=1 Tax=Stylonychia lemnae TaxID=5949 RepID=A0A078A1U0_STYLE|nr:cation channel family protein [Stylonychia lemnae]|eukprot:CDW75428.1 cation channel family protein [Stylonychia lemnae]
MSFYQEFKDDIRNQIQEQQPDGANNRSDIDNDRTQTQYRGNDELMFMKHQSQKHQTAQLSKHKTSDNQLDLRTQSVLNIGRANNMQQFMQIPSLDSNKLFRSNVESQSTANFNPLGRMKTIHENFQGTLGSQLAKNLGVNRQDEVNIKNPTQRQRKGFLRIGDIICITFRFEKQIVKKDKLANQKTNQTSKTGPQIQKVQSEKEVKSIQGVLWSDGVTNMNLNLIHKGAKSQMGSFSQFKKCLFIIESAQECQFNQIDQDYGRQIRELELELETAEGKDFDELTNEIQNLDRKQQKNNKRLEEEDNNNKYECQMSLGKKITYGQKIQLKHIFSGQYLSISPKKIASENGCNAVELSRPNENSWLTFSPSQKIRQNGQSISYQDSFFINNFIQESLEYEKPKLYVHVYTQKFTSENLNKTIEINGNNEASRLKAKLFIDYTFSNTEDFIASADTVKLQHKELNGYLTVKEKNFDVLKNKFPQFMIEEMNTEDKVNLGHMSTKNYKINVSLPPINIGSEETLNEITKTQVDEQCNEVYIETDLDSLMETNSNWEIQKVKPFIGGQIYYNDCYRFKHIGTGKFLVVQDEQLVLGECSMREFAWASLFKIRRDTYQPPRIKLEKEEEDEMGQVIGNQDLIMLQSAFQDEKSNVSWKDFLQIGQVDIQTVVEQEMDQEDTIDQQASIPQTIDLKDEEEKKLITVTSGKFLKEDVAKMVFMIEKVSDKDASITYEGQSYCQTFLEFHDFILLWAVNELVKTKMYNQTEAIETEEVLSDKSEEFMQVLTRLYETLYKAKNNSRDQFIKYQNHLAEQGVLHMLIKLLELIYYKTVPKNERYNDNKKQRDKSILSDLEIAGQNMFGSRSIPETIASDHLDQVSNQLLRVINVMIKNNPKNAAIVTQNERIIYRQIKKCDTKLITSIFREAFKRSQMIHYTSEELDSQDQDSDPEKQDKPLDIIIKNWGQALDTPTYNSENDDNIHRQMLHLKVLSMICCDNQGNGIYHYQLKVMDLLTRAAKNEEGIQGDFNSKNQVEYPYVPINFSQDIGTKCPIVTFLLKNQTREEFDQHNPFLAKLNQSIGKQSYLSNQYKKDPTFNLEDISLCQNPTQAGISTRLSIYIDYICCVIELFSSVCLSGNFSGIQAVQALGITREMVLYSISQHSKLHPKFKSSFMRLFKVMFIDYDVYQQFIKYNNRCYIWDYIGSYSTHRELYKLEIEQVKGQGQMTEAYDQNEDKLQNKDNFEEDLIRGNKLFQSLAGGPDENDKLTLLSPYKPRKKKQQAKHFQDNDQNFNDLSDIQPDLPIEVSPSKSQRNKQRPTLVIQKGDIRSLTMQPKANMSFQSTHVDKTTEYDEVEVEEIVQKFFKEDQTKQQLQNEQLDYMNHHSKKQEQNKTSDQIKKIDKQTLRFIDNHIDLAISLIKTEQVQNDFIYDMIQVAQDIFYFYRDYDKRVDEQGQIIDPIPTQGADNEGNQDILNDQTQISSNSPDKSRTDLLNNPNDNTQGEKSQKNQNQIHSWIVSVILNARKDASTKSKVEKLEYKTLKMLQAIINFKINEQVIAFTQVFKRAIDYNLKPDVDDANNILIDEFKLLFQMYQFGASSNGFNKEQVLKKLFIMSKMNNRMYMGIKELQNKNASAAEQNQVANLPNDQLKYQEFCQEDMIKHDEFIIEQELEMYANLPDRSKRIQNRVIELIQELKLKEPLQKDKSKDQNLKDKKSKSGKNKDKNKQQHFLNESLLSMIFQKTQNNEIKDQAVEVLVQSFRQRFNLVNEIVKVEILVTQDDIDQFLKLKNKNFRINELIQDIVNYNHYQGILNKSDKIDAEGEYIINVSLLRQQLNQITSKLRIDRARSHKRQTFLRHLDVQNDLIVKLMKKVQTKENIPESLQLLFQDISAFIFEFANHNYKNQRSLLPHMKFLLSQIPFDIPNKLILAQIINKHKHTKECQLFLNFVLAKFQKDKECDRVLMKILNYMVVENSQLFNSSYQLIILKNIVQKSKFLEHINARQIDSFESFLSKQKPRQITQKEHEDFRKNSKIHQTCIELLTDCSKDLQYGIQQSRKLIELKYVIEALQKDWLPLKMKIVYLRFLFEVYINDVSDISIMDVNSTAFIEVLKKILDSFQILNKAAFDLFTEGHKKEGYVPPLKEELYKQFKLLSSTNEKCSKQDGFLHFISDFYQSLKNVGINTSTALDEVNLKIIDFLQNLKNALLDGYFEFLQDEVEPQQQNGNNIALQEQNPLDKSEEKKQGTSFNKQYYYLIVMETLSIAPKVRSFKVGKKIDINEQNNTTEMSDESQMQTETDNIDIAAKKRTALKIIDQVKEYLIFNNQQISEIFDSAVDRLNENRINGDLLKKQLISILGSEKTSEITDAVAYFKNFSKIMQQIKNNDKSNPSSHPVDQTQINPNQVKSQNIVQLRSQNTNRRKTDFIVESSKQMTEGFQKQQIKGQRKTMVIMSNQQQKLFGLDLQLDGVEYIDKQDLHKLFMNDPFNKNENNQNENQDYTQNNKPAQMTFDMEADLRLFQKTFIDFCVKNEDQDELRTFDEFFQSNQNAKIKEFIEKMIKGFVDSNRKIYLMIVLNMILEQYMRSTLTKNNAKPSLQLQIITKKRLTEIQNMMKECAVCELALGLISKDEPIEVANQAILLLCSLLSESNDNQTKPKLMVNLKGKKRHLRKQIWKQRKKDQPKTQKGMNLQIYQDQYSSFLYQTVQQVLDTLIDFLYGPCRQNQQILGNWAKFCKTIDYYLSQDMGYYSGTTVEQMGKLRIYSSCTKLLIALIETDDNLFRYQQFLELTKSISVENLIQKMVEIFIYKIGCEKKKQKLYRSNKQCNHIKEEYCDKEKKPKFRLNMCEPGEFCEFGHMTALDNIVISSGFNTFIFLQIFKQTVKSTNSLEKCDFEMKKELRYREFYEKFSQDFKSDKLISIKVKMGKRLDNKRNNQPIKIKAEDTENQKNIQGKEKGKAKQELYEEFVKGPVEIYPIDRRTNKTKKNLDNYVSSGKWWQIWCCKKKKIIPYSYSIEQFAIDTAIRFYIKNVANIEINQQFNIYHIIFSISKDKLVSVLYKIPSFCTYMTTYSKKDLIYGANRESQSDKLEDFFSKINVITTEMKSLQKLDRDSKIRRWLTVHWAKFSNLSFIMIILINILFLIFYEVNDDKIVFQYPVAEIVIQIFGIIQAFLSFIVVLSYFQKYHAVFWQKHLEKDRVEKKSWFSEYKGSLGYAYGQSTYKLSQKSEQIMMQQLTSNSKADENKSMGNFKKFKQLSVWQQILQILQSFWTGLMIDMRHLFNLAYFGVSIAGLFSPTFFSILLLDIIIKIPLLTSVVQAIQQNKRQIIYTLLLLFIIIYIYSFIAFQAFRDNYTNEGTDPENSPDLNNYCNSLVMCFASTLNNGLRSGGGIGDVLTQLQDRDDKYWKRFAFDLSFFVVVIILLLNLIFGIIIDAFADMRDQRNAMEKDVNEKCFICGINRYQFEAKNKVFKDHVLREHNVYAYLFFILYVKRNPGNECTGVEKYVKNLVLKEDTSFFPVDACLAFQQTDIEKIIALQE